MRLRVSLILRDLSFIILISLGVTSLQAAPKAEAERNSCADFWGDTFIDVERTLETFSVEELPLLAEKYPDMTLNAFQRYARLILSQRWDDGKPYKLVRDPVYRAKMVKVWKVFSGIPEADGRMIEGEYEGVNEIVQFILEGAKGAKPDQAKVIKGPPGTGKTEIFYILDTIEQNYSRTRPEYFKLAVRFKNLSSVPYLRRAIDIDPKTKAERLLNPGIETDPVLGFLPASLQQKLAARAEKVIRAELGAKPSPRAYLDPRNEEILNAILDHEMRERGYKSAREISERVYMEILTKYLEIYRYIPDVNKDESLIRYVGEEPDYGQLFGERDLLMHAFYPNSALGVRYGQVLRQKGRGLFIDESHRDPEAFLNVMLEYLQNQVVAYGGLPPARTDTVVLFATNIESIAKMDQNAQTGANALGDRNDMVSMPQLIHPMQAAKVAMILMGPKNFWMRKLDDAKAAWQPASLNEIYTLPDERGKILGPEGRYAIKYSPQGPDDIDAVVIAPRALTYLGLIAASTRIVIDPKILAKHTHDLALATSNQQYVLDPEKRMRVILGDLSPQDAITLELDRIREVFAEGTNGVTARDTKRWMLAAIKQSREVFPDEPTLTPSIVLESLSQSMDSGKLKPKGGQSKADWALIAQRMTASFLQEWLVRDVRAIQSGDPTRIMKVYEDVAREIREMSSYATDDEGAKAAGDKIRVDFERYEKIRAIYAKQNNGRELQPTQVRAEYSEAKAENRVWQPLYKAVEEFMMATDRQTSALSSLEEYFSGRTDLAPGVIEKGREAEQAMSQFGYNKPAIRHALALIKDLQRKEVIQRDRR